MSRLIIIGNGFDLHHGLPTSVEDYRAIIEEAGSEELAQAGTGKLQYDSESAPISPTDFFDQYAPKWSTFEENLETIDIGRIEVDYSEGYDPISDREADREGPIKMREFANKIEEAIRLPLKQMAQRANSRLDGMSREAYPFHPDDIIITFNYTDTIEKLYIADAQYPPLIHHIHGRASTGDTLIFGHQADTGMPADPLDLGLVASELISLVNCLRKETKEGALSAIIGDEKIGECFVLGHSLSTVDQAYFSRITREIGPKTWTISHYNDDPSPEAALQVLGNDQRIIFKPIEEIIKDLKGVSF